MVPNTGKPWTYAQDRHVAQAVAGKTNIAAVLQERSNKKETIMNTTVTIKTFVGDKEASTLSTDHILDCVEREESLIARLNKIKPTNAVIALRNKHEKNVAALVALIG